MMGLGSARLLASMALACGVLLGTATPAQAGRGIVIDTVENANTLTSCGTDCFGLSIGSGEFQISPFGSITVLDRNNATFFAGLSSTRFKVFSGFTFREDETVDFVDFYREGRNLEPDEESGNREPPDFQITLRQFSNGSDGRDLLEIGFGYQGNTVPAGAKIGYQSGTFGFQFVAVNEDSANFVPDNYPGFPKQRFVTNSGGLKLGRTLGDSDFLFVLGEAENANGDLVAVLEQETFVPRYGPFTPPGVPEPASWAMLILGFGLVGSSARASRRRTRALAA